MLAGHALALVGVPMRRVIRMVQDAREQRYGLLRGFFHGADDATRTSWRPSAWPR
jgi:CPA2 family monovalent cation:H+ antiporter-2